MNEQMYKWEIRSKTFYFTTRFRTIKMYQCPECDIKFSRKDNNMRRHIVNGHELDWSYFSLPPPKSQSPPPPPPPSSSPPPPSPSLPPPQQQLSQRSKVVLQHPFTLMTIGSTFSGNSCWMNKLLSRAKTMINPPPERIIWCYKRWQSLFSEM